MEEQKMSREDKLEILQTAITEIMYVVSSTGLENKSLVDSAIDLSILAKELS